MPLIFARRMVVVSGGGSRPSECRIPTRLAAPAAERPARKRAAVLDDLHRPLLPSKDDELASSRLQLALQFVEKAPIRAVGDDLLRA